MLGSIERGGKDGGGSDAGARDAADGDASAPGVAASTVGRGELVAAEDSDGVVPPPLVMVTQALTTSPIARATGNARSRAPPRRARPDAMSFAFRRRAPGRR